MVTSTVGIMSAEGDQPIHKFGEVIRARREELGVSQRELARRVRSTQGHILDLEKGRNFPNVITAKLIADALGLEIIIRERRPST